MIRSVALLLGITLVLGACIDAQLARQAIQAVQANGERVEVMPVMLNTDPPFRYPPALYASKVQGNVTLRIFIDSTGTVLPESTMVLHSSGYPSLDSAAVTGSRRLRFRPARSRGHPVGVSAILPVLYRHPGSRPLPGDTILPGLDGRDSGLGTRDSTTARGVEIPVAEAVASPESPVPSPYTSDFP